MTSIGVLNGGSIKDIISADINTLILLWLTDHLSRRKINQIVANALCTWVVGCLAILYVMLGLGEHYFIIIVVNSMFLVPGSDMVNAFRNLLCGNEMNGTMLENAGDCALTLIGLSTGFVLISTFTYYRRVYFLSKGFASHLLHHTHKKR